MEIFTPIFVDGKIWYWFFGVYYGVAFLYSLNLLFFQKSYIQKDVYLSNFDIAMRLYHHECVNVFCVCISIMFFCVYVFVFVCPTVFTFRSWLDLLDVVLAFWISILKISKLLQNCLHRVIDITSFEKHLESSLDHTPNFCLNLVIFSFQEYVFKGISHPVFYGDLVYKLRRVKDTPNFISSGSKIVKRLRRRQYDPLIIETTIGLVLGPCTALCRLFLKHCTLTNKAVGDYMTGLV